MDKIKEKARLRPHLYHANIDYGFTQHQSEQLGTLRADYVLSHMKNEVQGHLLRKMNVKDLMQATALTQEFV